MTTPADRIKTITLSGRLGVKAEDDLAAMLCGEVEHFDGNLLLDMGQVEFISSSGLRALLLAYKRAVAANKKIALSQVKPAVYKIFKLTASEGLFHIHETNAAALAWLAEQP